MSFDSKMIHTADIQIKGPGRDAYNLPLTTKTTMVPLWPCRSFPKGGTEQRNDKQSATQRYQVFMRPPLLPDGTPFTLDTHSWLHISTGTQIYDVNVDNVEDPSGENIFLMVEGEVQLP